MGDKITALQALESQINKTSTSLSLRKKALALQEQGKSNILLLDTSASMDTPIGSFERTTRIDVLWNVTQKLRADGLLFKVCEFNSYAEWSDCVTKPIPQGGTEIVDALDFIREARPRLVTVITDGEPSWGSESIAIEYAKRLHCKINVVFVGDKHNERAVDFCKRLANACNGQYAYNSLESEQLQIAATQQVRLMLQSPEARPTTINL